MIPNKTPASAYRVRTLDRNELDEKGKIYIGQGETTTVDGVAGVSDITAKNIIDAINDNATDKNITAGSFTATGTIQSATLSCQGNITSENGEMIATSFRGNADSATNATYAQYASTDTSKGTIEERLTNLGFKQLLADRAIGMYVSGAGLNFGVQLLGNGITTREGNRTQIGFKLSFFASSVVSGPMLDFFGYGSQAISNAVIPAEYRPKFTSTCAFDCQLQYVYANGLSVKVHACMNCTIYGADTENAGKIALQVVPPNISGLSTTLAQVDIISSSSRAGTGYSSKEL